MSAWFSSLGQVEHCVKKLLWRELDFRTNARSNALAIHFPQIARANGFLQPKVQDFPNFLSIPHCPFWKAFLRQKN